MKFWMKIVFLPIAFLVMWIASINAQQHQVLHRGNDERNVNFVRHLRTFLDVTPFLRVKVEDLMSCVFSCLQHAVCLSFNMAVQPFEKLYDCLLLATDMYNSSENLQSSNDFNHHSIQSPCESSPCQNGGSCRPVYETEEYKCECAPGFVGINCEKSAEHQFNLNGSVILGGHPDYDEKLEEYLTPVQVSGKQWKLCFRASEHNYSSAAFHPACDNKGPTVTLVRVGIYVFGGYADKSWNGDQGWINSEDAFLFSLKNHLNEQHKMPIYQNPGKAMYSYNNNGPTFGQGKDLLVADSCDDNTKSYARLGATYRPPNGYAKGSTEADNLLAGSHQFKCDEYEVFYLE